MDCEVLVVGAGIGGLTVAALLAHRGVDVCLVERESVVGGCLASFEKFGYSFEPGYGLYEGWEPNGIHQQIFSELNATAPEVRLMEPGYTVRLPDQVEIPFTHDAATFEDSLAKAFPECPEAAITFYRDATRLASALRESVSPLPERLKEASNQTVAERLQGESWRFRRLLDSQLFAVAQAGAETVPFLYGALLLTTPLGHAYSVHGGGATHSQALADSFKQSGGRIRLNTSVLRLAYDHQGQATGVDLLTGERVNVSKAIVSNLTVWDTYGKLVGLNRTPSAVRQRLNQLRSWGSYLVYLGVDEDVALSLPERLLYLSRWGSEEPHDPIDQIFMSVGDQRQSPHGKRAVTVHRFTNVDDWFTFHTDQSEHESHDQEELEQVWQQLHSYSPAITEGAEVIETATPLTFYESTRRKLGMAGGLPLTVDSLEFARTAFTTHLPNLFIVSDTTFPGGLAFLSQGAVAVANEISRKTSGQR